MNRKNALKFVLSLAAISVTSAAGFIWAREGLIYQAFGASVVAWIGYLYAHKSATGKFIDGGVYEHEEEGYDNKVLPRRRNEFVGVSAGSLVLISGMVISAPGIKHGHIGLTTFGAVLFFSGYVIAHYSATKELL